MLKDLTYDEISALASLVAAKQSAGGDALADTPLKTIFTKLYDELAAMNAAKDAIRKVA